MLFRSSGAADAFHHAFALVTSCAGVLRSSRDTVRAYNVSARYSPTMSARALRKRARTEEDSSDQFANDGGDVKLDPGSEGAATSSRVDNHGQIFRRDNEFWFDDGTVILVAGDVEFRVYKGILSSHSAVFTDIFARELQIGRAHV